MYFVPTDKTPEAFHIHRLVVTKCAANWRELGEALGIAADKLNIVAADFPSNCEERCKQMLRRWVREDLSATWGKLIDAVHSPTVSYISGGK